MTKGAKGCFWVHCGNSARAFAAPLNCSCYGRSASGRPSLSACSAKDTAADRLCNLTVPAGATRTRRTACGRRLDSLQGGTQVDVLEPVVLLLRRMPRYCRPADARGTAGRDFDDFAEFQHYRFGKVAPVHASCNPIGTTAPSSL